MNMMGKEKIICLSLKVPSSFFSPNVVKPHRRRRWGWGGVSSICSAFTRWSWLKEAKVTHCLSAGKVNTFLATWSALSLSKNSKQEQPVRVGFSMTLRTAPELHSCQGAEQLELKCWHWWDENHWSISLHTSLASLAWVIASSFFMNC